MGYRIKITTWFLRAVIFDFYTSPVFKWMDISHHSPELTLSFHDRVAIITLLFTSISVSKHLATLIVTFVSYILRKVLGILDAMNDELKGQAGDSNPSVPVSTKSTQTPKTSSATLKRYYQ